MEVFAYRNIVIFVVAAGIINNSDTLVYVNINRILYLINTRLSKRFSLTEYEIKYYSNKSLRTWPNLLD